MGNLRDLSFGDKIVVTKNGINKGKVGVFMYLGYASDRIGVKIENMPGIYYYSNGEWELYKELPQAKWKISNGTGITPIQIPDGFAIDNKYIGVDKAVSTCTHPKKYKNVISKALSFWFCPDCREEVE